MKVRVKNIYEAKGGMMTKNDIINSIGCTLETLAKSHRGELVVPTYRFHIKLEEVQIVNDKATEGSKQ